MFPMRSRCYDPKIHLIYRNLYELATLGSDDDLAYWTDPRISSQSEFELLYKHSQDKTELSITDMRTVLLFVYFMCNY